MQCPWCGNTYLLPHFNWCLECGSPLPRASNAPKKVEEGIVRSTEQLGTARNNSGFGADNGQIQGENQHQEVLPTEAEQQQLSTGQVHGVTFKSDAYHGSDVTEYHKPVEEGAGSLQSDQRVEGNPSATSSQGQREEAVACKGASVRISNSQEGPNASTTTSGDQTGLFKGQGTPFTKGEPGDGNKASDHSVATASSSAGDTTKVENLDQEVRSPAVLEESSPNPSEMLQMVEMEQDPANKKPSDSQQKTPADRQQQVDKVKVVEDNIPTESVQGFLCDSAATHSRDDRTTVSPPKELQQKPQKGHDLPGSASSKEDDKTSLILVEASSGVVTRQRAATNERNQQSTASSSSATGGTTEIVLQHPLGRPENDDSEENAKGMIGTESGTWYRKGDLPAQELPLKNKKNQKKEGKDKTNNDQPLSIEQPPSTLQQVTPEAGVTVVFHVLLASNFKMTEESLFIRAHGTDLGDFVQNCVDMIVVEKDNSKDKDRLILFRGQFTISLDRARKGTFYKYVVVKRGTSRYEDLPEFPSQYSGTIVNRALKIPEKDLKPGVTWHQFDGVAYVYGDQSLYSRLRGYFARDKTVEYRTKALLCFLPKWEGFLVNETGEKMFATEALEKLQCVVKCLSFVWIEESRNYRPRQPNNFDAKKALIEHLKPKMDANIAALAKCKVGSSTQVSAVISSLAITILVKKYTINLRREEVVSLLSCLALEVDPTEKRCSVYEAVLGEFSDSLREYAASAIESLCNQLMKEAWTSNPEWLLAIPLLHFLRGDSKPFEEPDMGGWPQNLVWWGAENLSIEHFQRSHKHDFSKVLPRLASAFEVDRLLKRTFLHAIPVWQLSEIVSTRMFHLSDLLVALITLFPLGRLVNREKIKCLGRCVQVMVNMLYADEETNSPAPTGSRIEKTSCAKENPKQMEQKVDFFPNSSQTEITEFTVSASLKLVEMFIANFSLRHEIELICVAIELLFLSIQKWGNGAENKPQEIESVKEDVTVQLLEKLGNKLREEFHQQMQEREPLFGELQVWSKLLSVADGCRGVEGYRICLTQQFISRATRMRETFLVEIFCDVNLDEYDRAIGESFSKLAFEAVERIINSQQEADADRAFETLSGSSLRDDARATKFGELLSILLTKSWPKTSEVASRPGLDPVTVKFILSWNPMTGYLKFFDYVTAHRIENGKEQLTPIKANQIIYARN